MKYVPYDKRFDYLPGGLTKYGTLRFYKYNGKKKKFVTRYSINYEKYSKPLEGDETGLSVNQAWIALDRAWLAFKAYKKEDNESMMRKYANIINIMQGKLGLDITDFYCLS